MEEQKEVHRGHKRDLDPFPAFAAHGLSRLFELLCCELVDECRVGQPSGVFVIEQVAQHRPTRLFVGLHADELRQLAVGGDVHPFTDFPREGVTLWFANRTAI